MSVWTFDDVVKWAKDARAYRAYAREGWDQIRRNCCEMSMYDIRDAEQRARWCEARVRKEADAMLAARSA